MARPVVSGDRTPILTHRIAPGEHPIGDVWEATILELPNQVSTWKDWISDREVTVTGEANLSELLAQFPVAILIGKTALTQSP